MAFTGVLSAMLKASLVEDDQKTFNLAENEFKILLANSANNKKNYIRFLIIQETFFKIMTYLI